MFSYVRKFSLSAQVLIIIFSVFVDARCHARVSVIIYLAHIAEFEPRQLLFIKLSHYAWKLFYAFRWRARAASRRKHSVAACAWLAGATACRLRAAARAEAIFRKARRIRFAKALLAFFYSQSLLDDAFTIAGSPMQWCAARFHTHRWPRFQYRFIDISLHLLSFRVRGFLDILIA